MAGTGERADHRVSELPVGPRGPDRPTRTFVAALTVSQAALTALGAANGSLGAVALNSAWYWIVSGLALVLVGVFLVLLGQVKQRGWAQISGSLVLTAALLGTAYLVLAAPTKSSSPVVIAEVLSTKPPLLRGEVNASGIARGKLFQVLVNGLDLVEGHYRRVGPVLYHDVLGADSSGEIALKFKIPIHPRHYEAMAVIAWSHTEPPEFCGFSRNGTFERPEVQDMGCALIYLAAPHTTTAWEEASKLARRGVGHRTAH